MKKKILKNNKKFSTFTVEFRLKFLGLDATPKPNSAKTKKIDFRYIYLILKIRP